MFRERPPAVQDAVLSKWRDACQIWEMDSAANYTFGPFGTGQEQVETLAERNPCPRVLDVGSGSGGFLLQATELCIQHEKRLFGRGLSGGKEVASSIPVWDCEDWISTMALEQHQDEPLELLHRFPIERIHEVVHSSKFDLIVCSWTMRHLCDPLGTLEALSQLLAPDGVLVANQIYAPVIRSGGAPNVELLVEAIRSGSNDQYDVKCALEGEPLRYGEDGIEGGFELFVTIVRIKKHSACNSEGVRFNVEYTGRVVGPLEGPDSGAVLKGGGQYMMAEYQLGCN